MPYKPPQIPDVPGVLKKFQRIAYEVSADAVVKFAEDERKAFIRRIKRQDFKSFKITPLTPRWVRKKAAAGADQRVLIATQHYMRSIRVFEKQVKKMKLVVHVGFDRSTLARNLDGVVIPYPLYKVARVQEHGSIKAKVPARPHWKPHYETMRENAVPLRERIKQMIRRESLKRVGPALRGK